LRKLVPWSIERASRVVTPTNAVADEVAEEYGVDRQRVVVTPEGVSNHFFGATPLAGGALGRLGIPGPFVLAAGTLEPRKNLHRLLDAWSRVRLTEQGWSLVLAGPKGWGPELPETPGVILLGRVDDRTLPGLMAAAELFCYPSLYEGFGLPPLEAMATGTACIAGRYPAAPEVLGDAAELVDPTDVDGLAAILERLGNDEAARKLLSVKGRARATDFTWERTARATLEAYEGARSTP
jgi:glycosyltransferase involved in cell wall biosynthesis